MAKQIYSCEVIDYLREGKVVYYVDYDGGAIISLFKFSVSEVQKFVDIADKNNDSKTYFYVREEK